MVLQIRFLMKEKMTGTQVVCLGDDPRKHGGDNERREENNWEGFMEQITDVGNWGSVLQGTLRESAAWPQCGSSTSIFIHWGLLEFIPWHFGLAHVSTSHPVVKEIQTWCLQPSGYDKRCFPNMYLQNTLQDHELVRTAKRTDAHTGYTAFDRVCKTPYISLHVN